MPSLDGLTVVVGHAPRPGVETQQKPSVSSDIDFEEFLSKPCHDKTFRSSIHRIIEVDEGRKIIVVIKVSDTFNWSTPEVNALRLAITHDGDEMLNDVDVFIARPGSSIAQADNEGVEQFKSSRCSFDEFPVPVKDVGGIDQIVSFVVHGMPTPEDDSVPDEEDPGLLGSIRIRVERVIIAKKTRARKSLQRTSNASFMDDKTPSSSTSSKDARATEKFLKKGLTSRIQHNHGRVRELQRPNFKVATNGLVGNFHFHYRLPDRFAQLLESPCRVVRSKHGTKAVTAEDGEELQPILWGNRHANSPVGRNRTRLDGNPDNTSQEWRKSGTISDPETGAVASTDDDQDELEDDLLVVSSLPVPGAKATSQAKSSPATKGQGSLSPKESIGQQDMIEVDSSSESDKDGSGDAECLSDVTGEGSGSSASQTPPPPTRVLRGQSGELFGGAENNAATPAELSEMLDYIVYRNEDEERVKNELAERERTATAKLAEKRAARHAEIVKLQLSREQAAEELKDVEAQLDTMRNDFDAELETLEIRKEELRAEKLAQAMKRNQANEEIKNLVDESKRLQDRAQEWMAKKRERDEAMEHVRAKQARLGM